MDQFRTKCPKDGHVNLWRLELEENIAILDLRAQIKEYEQADFKKSRQLVNLQVD